MKSPAGSSGSCPGDGHRHEQAPSPLELSVIVPTFGRNEKLANLLARCDRQTLPPRRFEVIVVDDGSPQPVVVEPSAHRFALSLLRQSHAGPAAARNLALRHCHGRLVLFLDDDSLPAYELFERHVEVHQTRSDKVAVLGSFDFTADAMRHPFVQVLQDSDLLFDYGRARDGALHPWQYFWTCNISLPLVALAEVGGFDAELFPEAILEGAELGLRLSKLGYSVLYRKDLVCEHDHVIDVDAFFSRAVRMGVYSARLEKKHALDYPLAQAPTAKVRARLGVGALSMAEGYYGACADFLAKMRRLESAGSPDPVSPTLIAQLRSLTTRLAFVPFYRGQMMELEGFDPEIVMRDGPAQGKLTSIIVVCHEALEQTKACLARLRETKDPRHPTEILFVDNGSSDGSAQFLAAQSDVQLLSNAENMGAPRARNQALPLARGEYVVFLDNDAMVTPDWLARLLYHAEVNPHGGCIAPTSDRASHGQQIAMGCAADPDSIAQFARRISHDLNRQHFHSVVLASYCLLVPRRVLDAIGGFDERFTPWGFEDDDFTLRATLAGFSNRCARDVFVRHEAYVGRYKLERHSELLLANWQRFAEKWGLGADASNQNDARLAPIFERKWPQSQLRIPVDGLAPPLAPLPQPSVNELPSRRP